MFTIKNIQRDQLNDAYLKQLVKIILLKLKTENIISDIHHTENIEKVHVAIENARDFNIKSPINIYRFSKLFFLTDEILKDVTTIRLVHYKLNCIEVSANERLSFIEHQIIARK